MNQPSSCLIGGFLGGFVTGMLFLGTVFGQDIRQNIPLPLPMSMGGTGSTTGAKAAGPFTVANLLSAIPCNAAATGQIALVSDALTPALGTAIAGGGLLTVTVACNGSSYFP
jgi:hypothetical protein